MFVFDAGGIALPRYSINLPTKKHWSPSKLQCIEQGLAALIEVSRRASSSPARHGSERDRAGMVPSKLASSSAASTAASTVGP